MTLKWKKEPNDNKRRSRWCGYCGKIILYADGLDLLTHVGYCELALAHKIELKRKNDENKTD